MEKNLTTGSVFKNVILFSLPYLFSYFLQTLYGMADLFIIGQYDGVASTTAVSIGSQIMHMITVMIVGLAMGTTVSIAQAVGANNKKQESKAVGNTIILFMGVAIAGMALLLILVHPHCIGDVYACGGCKGNGYLSDDLLYRHSVYHRI